MSKRVFWIIGLAIAHYCANITIGYAKDVIFNNRTGVSLNVYERDLLGTETFSFTIFDGESHEFDATPGDIFKFVSGAPSSHENVDQIKINEKDAYYNLSLVKKTADSLPASYKSVPNFDPNLHSYDIFYVDPFHIDNSKAKKGLVFERLDTRGRDYVVQDGNIIHKEGFAYVALDEGWGSSETEFHSSTRSFLEKFSLGIQLGASKGKNDKKAAGNISGSYSKMTKDVTKDRRAWTITRQDIVKYRVAKDGTNQKLSAEFVLAVRTLSDVPNYTADQIKASAAARADLKNTTLEYDRFIAKWGTHYPTEINYGGMYLGIRSMTESQVVKAISEGWDLKVEAQMPTGSANTKGTGEYGQKTIKTNSDLDRHSKSKYQYRGGEGGLNNWNVNDGAQPVSIKLARLHLLLTHGRLSDYELEKEVLNRKKVFLRERINDYLGNAKDVNGFSIKPRVYKLSWTDLYANDLDNSDNGIFGEVKVEAIGGLEKNESSDSAGNHLWKRTEKAGSRVIMNPGQSYESRYPGAFTDKWKEFIVHPGPQGDYDVSKKAVRISAKLYDYDKSSSSDTIGSASELYYLKDFGPGKKIEIVVNDGGDDDPNDNGKITLKFDLEEISSAFSYLYDD